MAAHGVCGWCDGCEPWQRLGTAQSSPTPPGKSTSALWGLCHRRPQVPMARHWALFNATYEGLLFAGVTSTRRIPLPTIQEHTIGRQRPWHWHFHLVWLGLPWLCTSSGESGSLFDHHSETFLDPGWRAFQTFGTSKILIGKRRFETVSRELHQQHGAIVRYGRNRYIIDDPEAGKIIYSFSKQFQKSAWYNVWSPTGLPSMFSDRDIKRHAATRKLFQNTYSMSSLVSYEPYVSLCGDLLIQHLTEVANEKSKNDERPTLDLTHWLQCYAFDVISGITFGKRLGFLDAGQDIGRLMAFLDHGTHLAAIIGVYASMRQLLMPLSDKLGEWRGLSSTDLLKFTVGQIQHYCGDGDNSTTKSSVSEIEEGLRGTTVQEPFAAKFCRRHNEDPESMPMQEIISTCLGNMFAGSDTTGISLSACIFYLLKNPACLEELRQEVDAIQNTCEVADRGYIRFSSAQKMPYMQAVIKEAPRLHPAVALPLERIVPAGGATIAGTFFPEGPSRWLSEDTERVALMSRSWIPVSLRVLQTRLFGLGTRTCIGRHISHLEISTLIPRLVADFDFQLAGKLAEPDATYDVDNGWFAKQRGFKVNVELRKKI
ncbi:cytochrome P450 [Microdochium bolleyi]|uniref:Cytochrome P450 n=1 Tax=Microdochium bolleyi TaxID=196109 RepID=A0A136IJI6_9PEZI|nr:cytochrome P450 [Microdochium bolleyi]